MAIPHWLMALDRLVHNAHRIEMGAIPCGKIVGSRVDYAGKPRRANRQNARRGGPPGGYHWRRGGSHAADDRSHRGRHGVGNSTFAGNRRLVSSAGICRTRVLLRAHRALVNNAFQWAAELTLAGEQRRERRGKTTEGDGVDGARRTADQCHRSQLLPLCRPVSAERDTGPLRRMAPTRSGLHYSTPDGRNRCAHRCGRPCFIQNISLSGERRERPE